MFAAVDKLYNNPEHENIIKRSFFFPVISPDPMNT